jgi:acetyl esterase/lipase
MTSHNRLAYVVHPANGTYASQIERLALRVPTGLAAPPPLIMMLHGGGWTAGGDKSLLAQEAYFVNLGYAVASVEYRLADGAAAPPASTNLFPAGLQDVRCAARWLIRRADHYGYRAPPIGLFGQSAGGNLAAMLVATRDRGVPGFDSGDCPYGPLGDHRWHPKDRIPIDIGVVTDLFGNNTASSQTGCPSDVKGCDPYPFESSWYYNRITQSYLTVNDILRYFGYFQLHPHMYPAPATPQTAQAYAERLAADQSVQSAMPTGEIARNWGRTDYALPPFVIFNGAADTIVPSVQSVDLIDLLASHGVPVIGTPAAPAFGQPALAPVTGLPHGFSPFQFSAAYGQKHPKADLVTANQAACNMIAAYATYLP